jgi:hypothetical protein
MNHDAAGSYRFMAIPTPLQAMFIEIPKNLSSNGKDPEAETAARWNNGWNKMIYQFVPAFFNSIFQTAMGGISNGAVERS